MKTSLTPASRTVIDSWAWVEYFAGSEAGKTVERVIQRSEVWTSSVSLAEVVSKYRRAKLDEGPAVASLLSISRIFAPDEEDAEDAGRIHAQTKLTRPNFSLGDSFVLQLARKLGCRLLTGDPDFRGIEEADLLETFPKR
jgi:predicted nucleic acid-binding protein